MKRIGFNGKWFSCEIKEESLRLYPLKIKYITRVSKGSPAAQFGIVPGDVLGDVNQQAAVDVDLIDLYGKGGHINYFIYRPSEQKSFLISTPDMPLGIETELTSQSIVERSGFILGNVNDLQMLWQRGDWKALELSAINERYLNSWFIRLVMFILRRKYEGPAILMHGIALYEQGDKDQGIALIDRYRENYIDYWTTQWHALTYYYTGLSWLERNDKEQGYEYLYAAENYCRCPVLAQKLSEFGIEHSDKHQWSGQRFPIDFELQNFEQTGRYQLSELLSQLKEKQLLYLCVMPSYRANGPYDDILQEFDILLKIFDENTSPLYVITDRKDEESVWLDTENRMRKEGKPIVLLFDEHNQVSDVLKQTTTPNMYVLNKQGVILGSGIEFSLEKTWAHLEEAFGNVFETAIGD